MNNSISEAHKTPSLIPQKKEFDQNLSENVSTISSKKNKVFEKFKSIVDSFMKFIRTYIIDKPKNFFKSCFMKKEEPLNIGDNINQFRLLIKECHEKNIPYKIQSLVCREFCRAAISTSLISINNNNLDGWGASLVEYTLKGIDVDVNQRNQLLVEKTGISKEIIIANSKYLFSYRTRNQMFLDLPSYVGKVENEKYKFLEGKNLHEMMDKIQSVEIEYDGSNHHLYRAQGVSDDFLPEDLFCSLYATKEEADKAIQGSNKLLKAATE